MYVCACNTLTEVAVVKAVQSGARTASQIYVSLGCAPLCGHCLPRLREIVRTASGDPDRRSGPTSE